MTETFAAESDNRDNWKVCDLKLLLYGDTINGHQIMCEPSVKDISQAINSGDLEARNYQSDFEELKDEWISESQKAHDPLAEWKRVVTQYHARRIAYFVENGWTHPISIKPDGTVTDGTHRAKAAVLMALESVEVCIKE